MKEPKLRTVNKAVAPFKLNEFPPRFVDVLARNIVYLEATKQNMSISGDEWEEIFAECIGARWKPSNVGLDDVVLGNCCWSAKTVSGSGNLETMDHVRLISGRNSPTFSFGEDMLTDRDPESIARMVLSIWNERVSSIRERFKFARTVVLVRARDFRSYLVFEFDAARYDPDLYAWEWNKNNNPQGYDKNTGRHRFTWQPSGSQFTIIEPIPEKRLYFTLRKPTRLDKNAVLYALQFDKYWYDVKSTGRDA